MDEKDRFGDKLHDKGRADEDRYFAEQDEKLRAKLQQKAADEREVRQLDPDELENVVEHGRKTGWLTRCLDRIRGR